MELLDWISPKAKSDLRLRGLWMTSLALVVSMSIKVHTILINLAINF